MVISNNETLHDERALYNSRIFRNYIKLINLKYSHVNVNELLSHAQMEMYQVEDEGHWFTQKQANAFHEKLSQMTGNKDISREAGLFTASPDVMGGMKRFILGLAGPSNAYALVSKFSGMLTRSSTCKSSDIGPNKIEITFTPNAGVKEEPFQCENRRGSLESLSRMFKYRLPKIEHPECIFQGGASCRYIVSWRRSRSAFWKSMRSLAALVLAVVYAGFQYFSPEQVPGFVLPAFVSFIFLLSWYAESLNSRELRVAVDSLRDSSDELAQQIGVNYDNALMINEIAQTLGNESEAEGVLSRVTAILKERLDLERGIVLLASSDRSRLQYSAAFGYGVGDFRIMRERDLDLLVSNDAIETEMAIVCFKEKRPIVVNDVEDMQEGFTFSAFGQPFAERVKSVVCCPITYEDRALGALVMCNTRVKKPILQRDLNLLMGIAAQIGISIYKVNIETQLRQAHKMESVGRLAGGVAHDFNNLLSAILGYCELSLDCLEKDSPLRDNLRVIMDSGEKARTLTAQLLAFSRRQVLEVSVVNLNSVIEGMRKILERLLGEGVELEVDTDSALENIKADAVQMDQILINLAVNARDAMSEGGQLYIQTHNEYLGDEYCRFHKGVKPGPYVMLSVADTGVGMSRELQENIFEPFFTTKDTKGTGLGLSTVYGIVKQHSGHIFLYSEPDSGTVFKIYFPSAGDMPAPERPVKTNGGIVVGEKGRETIMVVEDDESIRNLIKATLGPQGYRVITASSAEEALDLSESTVGNIDLVLTDVVMPGINGLEMSRMLCRKRPSAKVVFMSGYTDNIIANQGTLEEGVIFISKPILPSTLSKRLREVLDEEK